MSNTAKIMVVLSRILVGVTFVFSGLMKAVDPLGFTYKIEDYLIELDLTVLFPLALPAALLLVTSEFALGVFLLLGIYRKWTTRLILLFMIFFTPLTLWVAIANPVEDCGCFGDAFIISNWHTFYKNMVLLAGAIWLVLKWKQLRPLFTQKMALPVAAFTLLLGLFFALHNVYRLPVIDFRPYRVGANIPQQMYVDPEKADLYETIFMYSKEGVTREFTEENYPWNDSTWTFVEMKTNLVRKGEKSAIEDFAVEALYFDETTNTFQAGGDITDILLSNPSYSFLMVAYSLEDMHMRHLNRFRETAAFAAKKGFPFYILTASDPGVVGDWEEQNKTGFQFAHADERVLKTMIRSNPGLMLLKEGTVMGKWDDSMLPATEKIALIIK